MRLFLIAALLLAAGCSIKPQSYRYVSLERCHEAPKRDLGLYEIELPDYFIDERLPYKEGERLGYLEQKVAREPREFLSRCAAKALGACLYPWDCEKKPAKILRVRIDEFYFDRAKGEVVIVAAAGGQRYRVAQPVEDDPVAAALRAYRRLLAQIGR